MNPFTKTTIGIVDDHWQVRDGLTTFINSLPNFKVILTAENGQDLIDHIKAGSILPAILIVDIRMSIMDGIATTEWVHLNHPEIKVIGLSANYPPDSKFIMLKHGCVGFLNKTDNYATFQKALEDVVEHGVMSECSIGLKEIAKKTITLKERELEFLQWICSDLTLEEIANKMNLSAKSVEGYSTKLHKIFDVHTRQALMNSAYHHGFILRKEMEEVE